MASIVDPPPDGNPDLPGVQQISPEAALWLVRRSVILDYLNKQQPVHPHHNKRMAADLIREVQAWWYGPAAGFTVHERIHHAQAGALLELADQLAQAGHCAAATIAENEAAIYSTWALGPDGSPAPDGPMASTERRRRIRERRAEVLGGDA